MKQLIFREKKNKNDEPIDFHTLANKKIPILVLDKNWHYMFPPGRKTKKMIEIENKLNKLLKEQGKLTNKEKDFIRFKKECVNQIMNLMEKAEESEEARKDMGKSQQYIEEINNQLENIERDLEELPRKIKFINNELLNESIQMCYTEMNENKKIVNKLDIEINELKEQIKNKIEEKTTKEELINRTYLFLHNLVGVDLINKLDTVNME